MKSSADFPGHQTARMAWSKNVCNEENCPVQILLPDMKAKTCPHLAFAMSLERLIDRGNGARSQWPIAEGTTTLQNKIAEQNQEAHWLKTNHSDATKRAIQNPSFVRTSNQDGKPGFHLIWKLLTTTLARRGCDADSIHCR